MDPAAQDWIVYTFTPGAAVPCHAYRGYAGGSAFDESTAQQVAVQLNSAAQQGSNVSAMALPLEDAVPPASS